MLDYRQRAGDSPMAWCMKHERLITANKALEVLKTAFRITDTGVFPYATCDGSCMDDLGEEQS